MVYKIIRFFRMVRAMNRSPRFQLGDVVSTNGRSGRRVEHRAVIRKKFMHAEGPYGRIVNTYAFYLDGVDGYFFADHLVLEPMETETEMWLSNE